VNEFRFVWVAHGRYEIYARAIGGDRSYSVSLDGGEEPIFSEDGTTIF